MGFLNGRVSYVRYRVVGGTAPAFDEDLVEAARRHLIGRHGSGDSPDGVSVGWAGGDHLLDTSIDLGKNLINDALHLAMRLDTDKIPGTLLRAYTKIETDDAKKIVKQIKGCGVKVQAQIMDEKIRVTAKKIDDLQGVIAYLKADAPEFPLQYTNFS